jgi:flavin reductase (DIM6/NTAB) family NADH-FMN oxidoreductase RutF
MRSNDAPVVDAREFRRVIGLFATGVSVVAVQAGEDVRGMTANALMSVSLDPLLVCVSVDRRTRMNQLLDHSSAFTINVLHKDQEPLSRFFAGQWKQSVPPEYHFKPWLGGARLEGCLAALACQVHEVLEGGDHRLFLARVIGLSQTEGSLSPLLFFGGQYHCVRTPTLEPPEVLVGEL